MIVYVEKQGRRPEWHHPSVQMDIQTPGCGIVKERGVHAEKARSQLLQRVGQVELPRAGLNDRWSAGSPARPEAPRSDRLTIERC